MNCIVLPVNIRPCSQARGGDNKYEYTEPLRISSPHVRKPREAQTNKTERRKLYSIVSV